MNKEEIIAGIEYTKPKVYLLQESGLGTSEFAGRTAYNSFDKSENDEVIQVSTSASDGSLCDKERFDLNHIEHSNLLDSLAWVHHHHSVLEHCNLTFLIKGTSRGVLQEHARHRLQSITVQSTRYTMNQILNAYVALNIDEFKAYLVDKLDMFVLKGEAAYLEAAQLYSKLKHQELVLGKDVFNQTAIAKASLDLLGQYKSFELLNKLNDGKTKRNVGDSFKWIVTDNWKVDMVVTFNLRSIKNYFELRDSGAAYFQIRWLAQEMKRATPLKYLKLIDKKYKES